MPAVGSSSNSRRGSSANASAMSSSFWSPWLRLADKVRATGPRPVMSMISPARARAPL
jgi:hypothetical protein